MAVILSEACEANDHGDCSANDVKLSFMCYCDCHPTQGEIQSKWLESIGYQEGEVIVQVHGGIAEVVKSPPGVSVRILDYDVEAADEDRLSQDVFGTEYVETGG